MLIVLFHKTPLCIDFWWGREAGAILPRKRFSHTLPLLFSLPPMPALFFIFFKHRGKCKGFQQCQKKKKKNSFVCFSFKEGSSHVTVSIVRDFLPAVPQYRAPFLVDSNSSMVCVNWSGSFFLNGPLREFVLMDGAQRVYSGSDTTLYIPRTADKSECPAPAPQRAWVAHGSPALRDGRSGR